MTGHTERTTLPTTPKSQHEISYNININIIEKEFENELLKDKKQDDNTNRLKKLFNRMNGKSLKEPDRSERRNYHPGYGQFDRRYYGPAARELPLQDQGYSGYDVMDADMAASLPVIVLNPYSVPQSYGNYYSDNHVLDHDTLDQVLVNYLVEALGAIPVA